MGIVDSLSATLTDSLVKKLLIEVPTSFDSPPLYRIQPYGVNSGTYFAHSESNRFSLEEAPCCYLSDDYQTAFKEAMHYLIKSAIKAKELNSGRPIITKNMLQSKGVWRVLLPRKMTLIDFTSDDIQNKLRLNFHPGLHVEYKDVSNVAKAFLEYSNAHPELEIQGFYYPTQNMGRRAIAVWQTAHPLLESGKWSKDSLWDTVQPFLAELAEKYHVSFYTS